MANRRRWLGRSIDRSAKWLLRFRIFKTLGKWIVNSRLAWSLVSRIERVRGVRARSRLRELDPSELPQHISIIMDGNRRFAWAHSMESGQGHSAGKERLKEVMKWVLDLDIPYLTVYALSSENLTNRTEEEIEILFDLYVQGLNEISVDPLIHENGVRVNAVGRLDMLRRLYRALDPQGFRAEAIDRLGLSWLQQYNYRMRFK